jgi:hypothetical protein
VSDPAGPTVADLDAAWSAYAARLKAAGERITGEGFPADPRLRAEGYRYVSRLANLAHQIYVEFGDPGQPVLFRYGDSTTPFGATNVDNNLYRANLDASGTYLVTGNVRGVKELLFSVQDGEFVFGRTTVLAEAALDDLVVGDDGRLELTLGGPEQPANWLPLAPDAVYLNVREFVGDWEHDALADLCIERLGGAGPSAALTPGELIAGLEAAASWVEASVRVWNEFGAMLEQVTAVNEFPAPRWAEGGADNMLHGAARWQLEPDQALVIELERPDVTYWSFQTYLLEWLVPFDFTNRVTSLNDGQARVDDDGRIRLVLSHADPGVHNWLDTSGLDHGLVTYRYVRAKRAPRPAATVVALDEVRAHLPASTPPCMAEERRAQIAARRRGAARRFRR